MQFVTFVDRGLGAFLPQGNLRLIHVGGVDRVTDRPPSILGIQLYISFVRYLGSTAWNDAQDPVERDKLGLRVSKGERS